MFLRRTGLLAALWLYLPTLAAQPSPTASVRIEGAVRAAGDYIAPNGRLSGAIVSAGPTSDAFLPGASFNRASARREQVRSRAGLSYSLAQLATTEDPQLRGIAQRLQQWVATHEATGRVPILVDARLMQAQPQHDAIIEADDRLFIPARPTSVQVLGAVDSPCNLPHRPLKSAQQYLAECPRSKGADRDKIYIIQPDGVVQELGVSAWNRSDPKTIAPGGYLYVPIAESRLRSLDPDFNAEFAAFIATQPVSQ
jgi:hypothetical protein